MIQNELPVSNHAVQTVKTIIKLETTDNGTLYGKTGGLADNSGQLILGWFVGFVETKNGNFVFATNIKQGDRPGGWKAKKITKDILNNMNLL